MLTLYVDYLKQTLEGAIIDPRKNQRVMRALLAAALFCRYFELGGMVWVWWYFIAIDNVKVCAKTDGFLQIYCVNYTPLYLSIKQVK